MYPLGIFIGGPTASGKTKLDNIIHSKLPSYIVNADSMQVYDQLKILTNKPDFKKIKNFDHNLFGFTKYPKKCDVGIWQKETIKLVKKKKNLTPIFVGGTGLYLESLTNNLSNIPKVTNQTKIEVKEMLKKEGHESLYKKLKKFDKDYASKISKNDLQRILRATEVRVSTGKSFSEWHKTEKKKIFKKIVYVIIKEDRDILYGKINKRCKKMVKSGVIDEVKEFNKNKIKASHPLHKSIGLDVFTNYLNGIFSLEECLETFMKETRQYAKRQLTWFNNRASQAIRLEFSKLERYIIDQAKL